MIDRYLAIERILEHVGTDDLVLSTTGMISREVFVTDDRPGNFYMLGSMGLLSSLGLGLALMAPKQRVIVIEGDGSALMALGTIPLIGAEAPSNLFHVILDNEAYESTGGQPSITTKIDLSEMGPTAGYSSSYRIEDVEELASVLDRCAANPGPHLLLVKVGIAPVKDIPRVSHSPTDIRDRFKSKVVDLS